MITSIIVVKNNRIYNNIDRSRLSFFFDVPYAIPPFLSFSLILSFSLSYVCPINFFARSSSLSPIGEVKSLVAHNSAESKTTLLVSLASSTADFRMKAPLRPVNAIKRMIMNANEE